MCKTDAKDASSTKPLIRNERSPSSKPKTDRTLQARIEHQAQEEIPAPSYTPPQIEQRHQSPTGQSKDPSVATIASLLAAAATPSPTEPLVSASAAGAFIESEAAQASSDSATRLADIISRVESFCTENSKEMNSTIGKKANFLSKFLFAISKSVFSDDVHAQNEVFDFVTRNLEDFSDQLMYTNSKAIAPLKLMTKLAQLSFIKTLFTYKFPVGSEETAMSALTSSFFEFVDDKQPALQLEISSTIVRYFPQLANKLLANAIVHLPKTTEYAKMLLDNGANPLLIAEGERTSMLEYAWKEATTGKIPEKKLAAKELLKHAFASASFKAMVEAIQSTFPFLADELRADDALIEAIAERHEGLRDKDFLKKHVYPFLVIAKELSAPGHLGADFMASLDLPILCAIPSDSKIHSFPKAPTLVSGQTHRTGVTKFMGVDLARLIAPSDTDKVGEHLDMSSAAYGAAGGVAGHGAGSSADWVASSGTIHAFRTPGIVVRRATPPPQEDSDAASDSAVAGRHHGDLTDHFLDLGGNTSAPAE